MPTIRELKAIVKNYGKLTGTNIRLTGLRKDELEQYIEKYGMIDAIQGGENYEEKKVARIPKNRKRAGMQNNYQEEEEEDLQEEDLPEYQGEEEYEDEYEDEIPEEGEDEYPEDEYDDEEEQKYGVEPVLRQVKKPKNIPQRPSQEEIIDMMEQLKLERRNKGFYVSPLERLRGRGRY